MYYYSSICSKKDAKDNKNFYLIIVMVMITMNYGFRCYILEDSKNSMLCLLFLMSMLLFWRCFTIEKVTLEDDGEEKEIKVTLKGRMLIWVLIAFAFLKLITEIWFSMVGAPAFLKPGNEKLAFVLTFTFNMNNISNRTVQSLLWLNGYQILMLFIARHIMNNYRITLGNTEQVEGFRYYKRLVTYLRVSIFILLFYESFFGSSLYIFVLYIILREQILGGQLGKLVGNEKYLSRLRYLIVGIFLFRDVIVVLARIFFSLELKALLSPLIDEQFLRKLVFFYCCHLYIYFKDLKNQVGKAIQYENPQVYMKDEEFQDSLFRKEFLKYISRIMDVKIGGSQANYVKATRKLLKKYFEPNSLIKKYIVSFEQGAMNAAFKRIAELVENLLLLLASIVVKNFEDIFRYLAYLSALLVSARRYSYHTFELYDVVVLVWCFMSFLVKDASASLRLFAINLVFPCFIIGIVLTKFYQDFIRFQLIGKLLRQDDAGSENGPDINSYYKHHLYAFLPILTYTIFDTLREKRSIKKMELFRWLQKAEKISSDSKNKLDYLYLLIQEVSKIIVKLSRLITLSVSLLTSLTTVNLLNTFLLCITLGFFMTSSYDKQLWKWYIYYLIFLMAVSYLNQILPLQIESFNHEFLSMIGFSRQGSIYMVQFSLSFLTCYFASVYYKFIDAILEEQDIDINMMKENVVKMNELKEALKFIAWEKIGEKIYEFFVTYMVWIFHMAILFCMCIEDGDLFSLLLFFVDSLVFVVHLFIKWQHSNPIERNKRILKWYYASLASIVLLIFFRYIEFYTRYLTFRKMFAFLTGGVLANQDFSYDSIALLNKRSVMIRLLFKLENSERIDNLFSEFYLEIVYLALAALTYISLSIVPVQIPSNQKLAVLKRAESMIMPMGSPGSQQEKPVIRQSTLRRKSTSVEEVFLTIIEEEKKMTKKIDRSYFLIFFSIYFIYRSIEFTVLVYFYQLSIDSLNIMVILCELTYFNLVFWNLTTIFQAFHVEKFIKHSLGYFKNTFVEKLQNMNALAGCEKFIQKRKSAEPPNRGSEYSNTIESVRLASQTSLPLEEIQEEKDEKAKGPEEPEPASNSTEFRNKAMLSDIEQGKEYMDQLIIKVEKELIWLGTVFGFLKVLMIFLKSYSLMGEFVYNFSKEGGRKSPKIESGKSFLTVNTMFMCMILTELLLIRHYKVVSEHHEDLEKKDRDIGSRVEEVIRRAAYYYHFALFKVKEYVNGKLIEKENKRLGREGRGSERGSSFLQASTIFGKGGAGNKSPEGGGARERGVSKMTFLRKRETMVEQGARGRTELVYMNMSDMWYKEKEGLLASLKNLLERYLAVCSPTPPSSISSSYCFGELEEKWTDIRGSSVGKSGIEGGEEEEVMVMGQGTDKMVKFIFLHYNSQKSRLCNILEGVLHALRRLILLPLLFPVSVDPNLMNLPLLLCVIIYSFRGSMSVIYDLKLFLPLFTAIFALMFFGNMTAQNGNQMPQTSIMSMARGFATSQQRELAIMSMFVLIIGLSFIVCLAIVWYIVDHLFILTMKKKDIFFCFQQEHGEKELMMDFNAWRKSGLSFMEKIYSLFFDHSMEYYLLAIFVVSLFNSSIFNSILILFVLCLITAEMVPALRKYSFSTFSISKIRNFAFLFNFVIYLFFLNYTCTSILKNTETVKKVAFWRNLFDQSLIAFLFVMILNFFISDLVNSKEYMNVNDLMRKKFELKVSYAALQHTYAENEHRIFARINLMMKLKLLDDIEQKYSSSINNWKKLQFDYKYWEKELETMMSTTEQNLKTKYLSTSTKWKTNLIESFYTFCMDKISEGLFEDFLFLLMQVWAKNSHNLKEKHIEVDDYYDGDFTKYQELIEGIQNFYHGLRGKETIPSNAYETKFKQLTVEHERIKKRNQNKSKKGESTDPTPKEEVVLERKSRETLHQASSLLLNILSYDTRSEHLMNADVEYLMCTFKSLKVRFFNFKADLSKHTEGYQRLRFRASLRLLMQTLLSRLGYIVAVFIMAVQVYKGAMENFLLIGILFFAIMVETHHGTTYWWKILFVLYLAKCTLEYIYASVRNYSGNTTPNFFDKVFLLWIGVPDYTLDAYIMISIFLLNQVQRMIGFADKFMIQVEDPGTCLARVIFGLL